MTTEVTESDRIEYDALECKNISLMEYVRVRNSRSRDDASHNSRYMQQIKVCPKKSLLKSITDTRADSVRRTIVIDGANVMHCGSSYLDTRQGAIHRSVPDVAALLALMRYFVVRDFDVLTVISRKYSKLGGTNFKRAIDELVDNNLCVVAPASNLDDTIALEFAAQVNGVVLTSDLFRDHSNTNDRVCRIVHENRLSIDWQSISASSQNRRMANKEMDFQASKRFFFKHSNGGEMCQEDIIQRLHAVPDQLQYLISKERYDVKKPRNQRAQTLALLNKLIFEGLTECEVTYKDILLTPVHVPKEKKVSSFSESADIVREVLPDPQAAFIGEIDNSDDSEEW